MVRLQPILRAAFLALWSTTAGAQQLARLSGRVVSTDGEPVAQAVVSLTPTAAGSPVVSQTDTGGRFAFQAEAGTYTFSVRRIGFATFSDSLSLEPGALVVRNVALAERPMELASAMVGMILASRFFNLSEPNFFLFGSKHVPAGQPAADTYANETKFRVAIRYKLVSLKAASQQSGLYLGYTQNSLWNLWESSAPFYDNNYNPQAFVFFDLRDYAFLGLRGPLRELAPGVGAFVEHESNGRDGTSSRSWNRVGIGYELGDDSTGVVFGSLRQWWAFSVADENRDIRDRNGRGEVTVNLQPLLKVSGLTFSQAGLSARSRVAGRPFVTSTEIDMFLGADALDRFMHTHLANRFNGSVVAQHFIGTGESLLSYRERHRSFRLGVALVR